MKEPGRQNTVRGTIERGLAPVQDKLDLSQYEREGR